MSGVYHWLETNGLWFTVVGWAITGLLGIVVAKVKWLRKRVFHFLTPEEIRDLPTLLDTNTPGGLGDVAQALRELLAENQTAPKASAGGSTPSQES